MYLRDVCVCVCAWVCECVSVCVSVCLYMYNINPYANYISIYRMVMCGFVCDLCFQLCTCVCTHVLVSCTKFHEPYYKLIPSSARGTRGLSQALPELLKRVFKRALGVNSPSRLLQKS